MNTNENEYDSFEGWSDIDLDLLLGSGEDPQYTARALHLKEIYNKKASIFRKTICIPKLWLYKTLALDSVVNSNVI
ncbi:MAG TPA: hypothetical protein VM577_06835 [Anaerovoracaceae bacterium]|nr:hypothetical protein [Anaerovoracaceae bacterium]